MAMANTRVGAGDTARAVFSCAAHRPAAVSVTAELVGAAAQIVRGEPGEWAEMPSPWPFRTIAGPRATPYARGNIYELPPSPNPNSAYRHEAPRQSPAPGRPGVTRRGIPAAGSAGEDALALRRGTHGAQGGLTTIAPAHANRPVGYSPTNPAMRGLPFVDVANAGPELRCPSQAEAGSKRGRTRRPLACVKSSAMLSDALPFCASPPPPANRVRPASGRKFPAPVPARE